MLTGAVHLFSTTTRVKVKEFDRSVLGILMDTASNERCFSYTSYVLIKRII